NLPFPFNGVACLTDLEVKGGLRTLTSDVMKHVPLHVIVRWCPLSQTVHCADLVLGSQIDSFRSSRLKVDRSPAQVVDTRKYLLLTFTAEANSLPVQARILRAIWEV